MDKELWNKATDLRMEIERLDYKYIGYSLKDVANEAEENGEDDICEEARELSSRCWRFTDVLDEMESKHADIWENARFTEEEREELQDAVSEMESWKEEIEAFLDKHAAK